MGALIRIKCLNCDHPLGSTALNSGKGTRTCPVCKKKITVEVDHKVDKIIIKQIK